MDTSDHTWNVICPPKNWRKPIPIKETDLALLDLVAKRLSLVLTRDEERKKIYLGTALTSDASIANGVRYPSGWSAEVVHDAGAEYKAVDPLAAAPLIRAFPDAQISKNFRLSEFRPGRHTYEYIRISPALVRALEEIRGACGRPLSVTSGYRPPDYNREDRSGNASLVAASPTLLTSTAWPRTSIAKV